MKLDSNGNVIDGCEVDWSKKRKYIVRLYEKGRLKEAHKFNKVSDYFDFLECKQIQEYVLKV